MATQKHYEEARALKLLGVQLSSNRALCVISGSSDHTAWMSRDGSDKYCSCGRYESLLGLCSHLVLIACTVLGLHVEVTAG